MKGTIMFVGLATLVIGLIIFAVMWQGTGYTAFNDMNTSITTDNPLRAGVDIGQFIALGLSLVIWVIILFLGFVVLLMAFKKLSGTIRG